MIETTDISRLIEENNRLKAELINFQKTTNELELLKDENFRMKMKMQRLLSRLKDKTDSISQHIIDTDLQKREIQAQAESFLMESIEYEKLSIVARKTDNAVVIMDAKGNLEWVNDGFERLYEISFAELIQTKGKNIIDISSFPNIFEVLLTVINEKITYVYESTFLKQNGEKIWLHTTISPYVDDYGDISKIIAIESDITKLKMAEEQILQKNAEIESQRDALEEKNLQIELQNENIRGSIRYALTIQQAGLPRIEEFLQYFECFILYRPKDIVSGDFYWICAIDENKVIVCVADCTGHGVPGAFMSMIGNQLLNKIVIQNKITSPAKILEHLDNEILFALKQEQTDNQDGMDVCLCYIEKTDATHSIIRYSGSKRPLYCFSKSENSFQVIQGDRRAVGGTAFQMDHLNFTEKELFLSKGDALFMSSDGILDQNGTTQQKFGSKNLMRILHHNINLSMNSQKLALEIELDRFQGDEEQRDDISLMGIRL